MQADKLIKKYQILQFLRQMPTAMVASTYVVFLMGKGLSLSDLGLVGLSFSVVLLAAELPTGYFADHYGRRKSMIASCVVAAFAPFVYIWADNLWQCMIAESIFAVSCGFYNGALDAWIRHELQYIGEEKNTLKAFAKGSQAVQMALAGGALAGGYLASQSMILPWIIGGSMDVAALIAAVILMREHYQPFHSGLELGEGARTIGRSAALKFICALSFVGCFATAAANLYWQPFFVSLAPDPKILGAFCFVFFAVNFLGAKIAERFFAKSDPKRQEKEIAFSQLLIGLAVIVAAAAPVAAASMLFYVIHEGARGAFVVARQTYLQQAIAKESQRATIGSIGSFFEQTGSITAYLACGAILAHGSIADVWIVSGGTAIIASAILYRWRKTASRQE